MNGNTTDAINVRDIIELRKLFLEVNETYFDEIYGQNSKDDESGNGNDDLEFLFNELSQDLYLNYMEQIQYALGLVDADELQAAADADKAARERVALMKSLGIEIDEDNDEIGDAPTSEDIALEEFYEKYLYSSSSNVYPATKTSSAKKRYSSNKVLASKANNIRGAAETSQRSVIDANISGIPYEPTYILGSTYSGITFASPKGGVGGEGLQELLDEANKTRTPIPLRTNFWTEIVTTREEAEKHSEVSGGGSIGLAKKAAGTASFTVGTSSNYSFGLTSATLVIHFEVIETDYRLLTTRGYNDFARDNKLNKKAKKLAPDQFRDEYGDYFVAGYQYGACYEASIAITTDTTEQLDEVKSSLNVNGSYSDVTVSGDMKQKMTDTFKKNNARININVVTTGMGDKIPTILPITNSGDVSGLEEVFSKYAAFHKQVVDDMNANNRSNFVPIRVFLMRWRSLAPIADAVIDRWDGEPGSDGTIPITPQQKADADAMNAALANLRAYYNASAAARATIPAADNLKIVTDFNKLVGKVNAYGEDFYTTGSNTGDRITTELPLATEIATKCKDLTDRYVFYNKLIQAQKKEQEVTYSLNGKLSLWKDDADGDDKRLQYVHECPFGAKGGGNSGFKSFPMSAAVTNDFYACEKNPKKVFDEKLNKEWYCHKRVYIDTREGGTSRLEWWKEQRADSKGAKDWQPDVGDAYIEATAKDGSKAVFAYVSVESSATKAYQDRRRFIVGSNPAVGSQNVGFRFMSSYGNSVNWTIEGVAIRLRPEDYPFNGLID